MRFDEISSATYKSSIKLNISRNKHKKRPFYIQILRKTPNISDMFSLAKNHEVTELLFDIYKQIPIQRTAQPIKNQY